MCIVRQVPRVTCSLWIRIAGRRPIRVARSPDNGVRYVYDATMTMHRRPPSHHRLSVATQGSHSITLNRYARFFRKVPSVLLNGFLLGKSMYAGWDRIRGLITFECRENRHVIIDLWLGISYEVRYTGKL